MLSASHRKSAMIIALATALTVALITIALDADLRERLGSGYWIVGMAIIGCILLVLAGYVWDRTMIERLRTINESARRTPTTESFGPIEFSETEPDEIIGLARQIERMAQALQKTEASYRAVVEDQTDLICRCRSDGILTFVNGAFARFFGRKRQELIGSRLALVDLGYPHRDYQGNFSLAEEFEVELANAEGRPANFT